MEYKIPQNIEVEDRVVGPLTLRQFFILLAGALLVIVLNFMFPASIKFIFYLFALVIIGGTVAVAFIDYGGQHVEQLVLNALISFSAPRRRVWQREEVSVESPQKVAAREIAEIPTVAQKEDIMAAKSHIADLARSVDASSQEVGDANDMFQKSGSGNPLEALMKKVKPAKPKDPVVSQLSSVSPGKEFDYPKIKTASENPFERFKK